MKGEGSLEVQVFTAAGFGENAYLVRAPASDLAVAIDPGGAVEELIAALAGSGTGLAAILLTHAHIDHIEGVAALVRRYPAPIYLHPAEREWYERAPEQAIYFGMQFEVPPPADHPLVAGEVLELAGLRFEVRHVPGHAPGHVLLYLADEGVAFVGDVVFQGSIGRSDLPGGDFSRLMRSIREEVLTLPEETVLYPGHGPATTVAHETVANPFLVPDLRAGLA
jgi:glyoxylase-like metal-dependent hydrolase (beta-lactamase superfamily II)